MGNHCETSPTYVEVGFQIRDEIDSRTHKNSIFDRVGISNAVCKIGSDKYSVDGIIYCCIRSSDTFCIVAVSEGSGTFCNEVVSSCWSGTILKC